MKCSSCVVVPYKPATEGGDLDVHGFMYHGERNTDFVHPGCGGTFYEKADEVRLHGMFEPRFYTTDGGVYWVLHWENEVLVEYALLDEKRLTKPCQDRCRLDANNM